MPNADLVLVNASKVVTMRGAQVPRRGRTMQALGAVDNGAIAIGQGRILDVGTTSALKRRYRGSPMTDLEQRVALPGFVDAHTHLPVAGSRAFELDLKLQGKSYLDILRAGGGIHNSVQATRRATRQQLARVAQERMDTMLAWGTTTAEAKSGYGLDWATERKQLLAVRDADKAHPVDLVPTYLGAHVVPREFEDDRQAYVDQIVAHHLPRVAGQELALFCDAFLEENAFTRGECQRILTAAKDLGLKTKLHADEFTNQRGAQLAAQLGCTSTDHLLKVSKPGIRALAESDTIAVLSPAVCVASFIDDFAPARQLLQEGAAVALGTDFNPNCHTLSMPHVIRLAVHHLRMRPAQALVAATINAAHAIGRADTVGSLEPGKRADVAVLAYESLEELAYRQDENPIHDVYKAGRRVTP